MDYLHRVNPNYEKSAAKESRCTSIHCGSSGTTEEPVGNHHWSCRTIIRRTKRSQNELKKYDDRLLAPDKMTIQILKLRCIEWTRWVYGERAWWTVVPGAATPPPAVPLAGMGEQIARMPSQLPHNIHLDGLPMDSLTAWWIPTRWLGMSIQVS